MASFADKVKVLIDVDSSGAVSGLTKFKTSFKEAEGAAGKFKVVSSGAMDFVKANAASMAAGAGVAIAAFTAKAVGAFQELALGAEKFSNATGLAVEDASRYMEVLGDIGVEQGSLQTGLNKLNRAVADNSAAFADAGIEIAKTADGATDVNKTFLNTVEALRNIKDPAEKARIATQLLGKGWQELSTVINMGSKELEESLAAVADAKVIDPDEVRKAKQLRDTFDTLKDAGEEFALALGETVVPILADAVEIIVDVVGAVKSVTSAIGDFFDLLPQGSNDMGEVAAQFAKFGGVGRTIGKIINDEVKGPLEELEETTLPNVTYAWDRFLGELDQVDAFAGAKRQIDEVKQALVDAFNGESVDSAEFERSVRDAQRSIGNVVETLLAAGELSRAEANSILFNIKILGVEGLEYALGLLNNPALRVDTATVSMKPNTAYIPGLGTFPARGSGGPVSSGMPYLVGERGPELFVPGSSGSIVPNSRIGAAGSTINVTVTSADPNEVVRALQTYVRQSGPVPVNTRAM